jgi:ABC-type nitrate/sulfonate/bicarbonate transport system substrate-binding protein
MLRVLWTLALCGVLLAACAPAAQPASAPPGAPSASSGASSPLGPSAPAAPAAPTAPPPTRKVTVANTSLSLAIALFVARDKGMFQRHGLEVEVPLIAGVRSVQALVAREVEYALISGRTTTDAVLAGADLVMLASIAPTLSFVIFGAPGLTRADDLRGKTIGVASFGGSADFAARYGLRRFGLEPERDYALFQTGGVPESLAALQSGGVQAAVLSAPTTLQARKAGLSQVVDVTSLGIEYVFGALSTDRAFLAQEPDTTRRLLRGLLEGIHFAKTQPAATKQIIGPEYKTDDPEILDETYTLAVERMLARVPYVAPAGVKTVLDDAAHEIPAARTKAPEDLIDNSWLAELDASGFVKQLWGE